MNLIDMKFNYFSLCLIFVFLLNKLNGFIPADTLKRFEYKLSFKGPHLVFKDGTIPFWEHSGSTIASNDQIRITPSIRSQKGRLWSTHSMPNNNWVIEVALRINGRGRIGADGMAIWYTDKIEAEGPVFGSNDHWNGLGIFLDSFDNDAQQNNPYILIMTNDGTKTYDHHRDGASQQIGGCLRDFRNKPFPVRIKAEYYQRVLTIYYHNGLNNDLSNYDICARVENVDLPKNGHFGVTAATGGLADDHDVLSFITHSLIDHSASEVNTPSTEEQKKYDKEYEDFLRQLESEKEKYQKEHPEDKLDQLDEKKVFEYESDRQFRTILEVQNSIHLTIRALDGKLAEILGRQERIVSMISNNNGQQPQQLNQPQPSGYIDTFRRDEVNQVMTQQNELIRSIRDIYSSISDIHKKTNVIHDRPTNQIASQAQANVVSPSMVQQISDEVKSFRYEMNNLLSRNQPRCPEPPSCLSPIYFIVVIIVQSLLFLTYFVYK